MRGPLLVIAIVIAIVSACAPREEPLSAAERSLATTAFNEPELALGTESADAGAREEAPAPSEAGVKVDAPVEPKQSGAPEPRVVEETERYTELVDAQPTLPRDLVMFTATWCGYCKKARAWLTEKNVPFREVDVDNPASLPTLKEKFPNHVRISVPTFDWDGTIITGYSKARLEALLYPDGKKTKVERTRTRRKREWTSDTPRDYSAMYTYTDDAGALHIVKSLEEVPAAYRASAEKRDSY